MKSKKIYLITLANESILAFEDKKAIAEYFKITQKEATEAINGSLDMGWLFCTKINYYEKDLLDIKS